MLPHTRPWLCKIQQIQHGVSCRSPSQAKVAQHDCLSSQTKASACVITAGKAKHRCVISSTMYLYLAVCACD